MVVVDEVLISLTQSSLLISSLKTNRHNAAFQNKDKPDATTAIIKEAHCPSIEHQPPWFQPVFSIKEETIKTETPGVKK